MPNTTDIGNALASLDHPAVAFTPVTGATDQTRFDVTVLSPVDPNGVRRAVFQALRDCDLENRIAHAQTVRAILVTKQLTLAELNQLLACLHAQCHFFHTEPELCGSSIEVRPAWGELTPNRFLVMVNLNYDQLAAPAARTLLRPFGFVDVEGCESCWPNREGAHYLGSRLLTINEVLDLAGLLQRTVGYWLPLCGVDQEVIEVFMEARADS